MVIIVKKKKKSNTSGYAVMGKNGQRQHHGTLKVNCGVGVTTLKLNIFLF